MTCKVLSLEETDEWKHYLQQLPCEQQDIYYTPEYYKLYEELGDGIAQCFVLESGNGIALYPFLLNSINDPGFESKNEFHDIQGAYGYNGVVSTSFDNHFIRDFYNSFNNYCNDKNIIAEFTRFHPLLGNHSFSKDHLQVVFDRKTMYLDLKQSFDQIFKKFQTTTRKQIRRATDRYNIEVKIFQNDIGILDDFLSIYHEAMERANSIPYLYFNKQYFKSLIENIQTVFFVACHEKKPVAAISAFYNGYFIHGHLGGALTDYLHMSSYSLLYTEMIKFGQTMGCRFLHVGGGATNHPDDPLLKFKLNFSGTTADFYIGKKIHNQAVYNSIVQHWENKYPGKKEKFKNILLKYRY